MAAFGGVVAIVLLATVGVDAFDVVFAGEGEELLEFCLAALTFPFLLWLV